MFSLSGHLGPRAADLVDGRLAAAEEERAWSHVLTCPGCRRLVEREGWAKRQLGALSGAPVAAPPGPPARLLGSLYAVDAWAEADRIERRSTRLRTATVVVGGGAVGAAVLGLVAVAGPVARPDLPAQSPARIGLDTQESPAGSTTGAERISSAVWARRSR